MLLVVELKHDDLVFVGIDDALRLLGGLVQDVDLARDSSIRDDI
tara:strand:- start:62 stop:193 length:132 start_codon:yes stop_codon:yes gene_type:complete